ncbi:hypothetical protein IE53DRAFT_370818 [Violaceomyces palustris]|uniref:Uncharacterized protein n=1 Tax=Violaceomyces palustris TaxID=1673888 RepID=A0ACD0NQW7_9BASI|nr:hypothetical protein IE53DRAFT_370818 [Violaceomyces palustris]
MPYATDQVETAATRTSRDEQILSAKKKLKSFRAKQSLGMKKKTSSSTVGQIAQSVTGAKDSTEAVALNQEMAIGPVSDHCRSSSRGLHGRGHSRSSSISMAFKEAGARPTSTVKPLHSRNHSRVSSRNIIVPCKSRPVSVSGLGQLIPVAQSWAGSDSRCVLPGEAEWNDIDDPASGPSSSYPDLSSLLASPEKVDPDQHVPSASTPTGMRRLSRHARRASVATRRESLEIMGGLSTTGMNLTSTDALASKRRSSRMSGLPSASVLFGVPESPERDKVQVSRDWDWRNTHGEDLDDKTLGGDRLSALEKLEGRNVEKTPGESTSFSASRPSVRARRASGHGRQSSVQLPSFDDLHGDQGMDKVASLVLLESNQQTTSHDAPIPSKRDSWRSNLAPPPSASSSSSKAPLSPSSPSALLTSSTGPESIIINNEPPQPEGLGTLMEEEEEDELSSPVRGRQSSELDHDEAEDERKLRRLAEEEAIKRSRRASLTPRPLKLKSRPPSLYVAPIPKGGILASGSLPSIVRDSPNPPETSLEPKGNLPSLLKQATAAEREDVPVTDRVQHGLSRQWSLAQAQRAYNGEQGNSSSPAKDAEPETKRLPVSSAKGPSPEGIMPQPSTVSRQGMRTLRLGSQASLASLASITESSRSSSISMPSVVSNRRHSLIGSALGNSLTREELGTGLPSTAAVKMQRRSSIHYKPSGSSTAVNGGAEPPASAPSITNAQAFISFPAPAPVSMAEYDELRARASRDAATLESTRKQVERLERELAIECERGSREYAELERWSAEEKRSLSARIEELEKAASTSHERAAVLEKELRVKEEKLEDVGAERDMLQEDVEGWRSRCQDLEKSLRSERARLEEQRKLKKAAKQRIGQLANALEKAGQIVPTDELNILQALDDMQIDIAAVLRSPALGTSSPAVGGYFSPTVGMDPPQTIKLLADMRQQIFNLAGSLEHERSEHLKMKNELAQMQEANHRLMQASNLSANTSMTTFDNSDESGDNTGHSNMVKRSSDCGVMGKNRRHVFAYDSSMGSFGQSSTSLGSASITMTDNGTDVDEEPVRIGSASPPSKSAQGEGEVVGLGMGGLQTLEEVEEVSEQGAEELVEHDPFPNSPIDLEAGCPFDDSARSSLEDGRAYEDVHSFMPTTPALDPTYERDAFFSSAQSPIGDQPNHSSGSSMESHGPPSPPLTNHRESRTEVAVDEATFPPSPRPEFIPNWNFEMAARRGLKGKAIHGKQQRNSVEDFFGIMQDTVLPPLPVSDFSLEMPPIFVQGNDQASSTGPHLPSLDRSTRNSIQVAGITGSHGSGAGASAKRPPVARSAYVRDSFSSAGSLPGTLTGAKSSHLSQATAGGVSSLGSRALSRMSLQGLTSAFSGLGGYLTNQSGAAVTAAAAATKMCAGPTGSPSEAGSNAGSMSWTAEQRQEYFNADYHPAASRSFGVAQPPMKRLGIAAVGSSTSSISTASSSSSSKFKVKVARRFIDKSAVAPPVASQVWELDFSASTLGGPVFSL